MSNMSAETFSTCKLLDVRGLRVSFDAVDVLHGVDLTVHCGRIHALIGESGSGKSVLARSILGLAGRGARTTVISFCFLFYGSLFLHVTAYFSTLTFTTVFLSHGMPVRFMFTVRVALSYVHFEPSSLFPSRLTALGAEAASSLTV